MPWGLGLWQIGNPFQLRTNNGGKTKLSFFPPVFHHDFLPDIWNFFLNLGSLQYAVQWSVKWRVQPWFCCSIPFKAFLYLNTSKYVYLLSIIYGDKLRDHAEKGHSILLFSLAFFHISMTIFWGVKIWPTNKHIYPLHYFSVCLYVMFFLPPTFFSVCLSVTFYLPLHIVSVCLSITFFLILIFFYPLCFFSVCLSVTFFSVYL